MSASQLSRTGLGGLVVVLVVVLAAVVGGAAGVVVEVVVVEVVVVVVGGGTGAAGAAAVADAGVNRSRLAGPGEGTARVSATTGAGPPAKSAANTAVDNTIPMSPAVNRASGSGAETGRARRGRDMTGPQRRRSEVPASASSGSSPFAAGLLLGDHSARLRS